MPDESEVLSTTTPTRTRSADARQAGLVAGGVRAVPAVAAERQGGLEMLIARVAHVPVTEATAIVRAGKAASTKFCTTGADDVLLQNATVALFPGWPRADGSPSIRPGK